MHPGDLSGGFSDLKMTWLLYCAGAATDRQGQKGSTLQGMGFPSAVLGQKPTCKSSADNYAYANYYRQSRTRFSAINIYI